MIAISPAKPSTITIRMARNHQGDSGPSSTGLTIALLAGVAGVADMKAFLSAFESALRPQKILRSPLTLCSLPNSVAIPIDGKLLGRLSISGTCDFYVRYRAECVDLAQLRHKGVVEVGQRRWRNARRPLLKVLQSAGAQSEVSQSTIAELVQLRVRVIALENTVISLLARSSEQQLEHVRELAAYICPRPGFTPHHLTIRAAAEMIHLVERARAFQGHPAYMRLSISPARRSRRRR